jgi:hypothetical protein
MASLFLPGLKRLEFAAVKVVRLQWIREGREKLQILRFAQEDIY